MGTENGIAKMPSQLRQTAYGAITISRMLTVRVDRPKREETVLFGHVGAAWVRHLTFENPDMDASTIRDVDSMLAMPDKEFAAAVRQMTSAIYRSEGVLLERARSAILVERRDDRWRNVERIGRALSGIGPLSETGRAEGHFLIGYALWHGAKSDESSRHFELAGRSYRATGALGVGALSDFAAAASFHPGDTRFPERIQESLKRITATDPDAARRLAPAVDHDLAVHVVVQNVIAGAAVPTELPSPITEDDLNMLRVAMMRVLGQPGRAAAIARWIQSLRGLPGDQSGELDALVRVLGRVREWDALVDILRDMIAHGDERPTTHMELARALSETGRWREAKILLTSRVATSPENERTELLKRLIMLGALAGDPDTGRWKAELHAPGDEWIAQAVPPTMTAEALAEPELLARIEDGKLTIDPRLGTRGEAAIRAHIFAAMVLTGSPDQRAEALKDIAERDPDVYPEVVRLLPRRARPLSAAEEAMRRAEDLFGKSRFRESIPEYQEAIRLDPEMHIAHLYLGDAHYRLGEYYVAIAHFTESIAIRPTAQAQRFLGDAIRDSGGDLQRAKRCFEEALALDPAYAGAQEALEDIQARLAEDGIGE